jgi:signal transduction histidine kinase
MTGDDETILLAMVAVNSSHRRARMNDPTARFQLESRQLRRHAVVTVGPYALLGIVVIVTVISKGSAAGSLLVDLALCALAAGWMLWMFTLHPAWRDRPAMMTVFVTVLIVITAILVVRDPWFGCFTPALYVYVFRLLPWPWMPLGAGAVALVAGTAQAAGVDKTTLVGLLIYLGIVVVNVGPMSGLAWYAWNNGKRIVQREQVLHELSEANHRLQASVAENAQLHEQLLVQARESGMLDERQRMAREIHDTLAQGLTGIITQLQAAEHASDDPAEWPRHVAAATMLARESLTEARRSVHALRPEPLRIARLSEALAAVTERWSALHGIAVQVTTTGTVRPTPPDAEFALLRTTQEALANVAKHARATRVGVTLSYLEHEVALDVRDDGRGFGPSTNGTGGDDSNNGANGTGGGFGLVAMRQRIEGLCGTLRIESEPGAGTAISACIPATPAGSGR